SRRQRGRTVCAFETAWRSGRRQQSRYDKQQWCSLQRLPLLRDGRIAVVVRPLADQQTSGGMNLPQREAWAVADFVMAVEHQLPGDENLTAVVCETAQGCQRPFFRPVLRNHLGDERLLLGDVRLLREADFEVVVRLSAQIAVGRLADIRRRFAD